MKNARTISLFLSLFLLASCGDMFQGSRCTVVENDDGSATIYCDDGSMSTVRNGEDGQDGEDGADCAIPPETLLIQMWWNEADTMRRDCWNDRELNFRLCLLNVETAEDRQACNHEETRHGVVCSIMHARKANVISLRTCGVAVFLNILHSEEDFDFENPELTPIFEVNHNDEDGDGIPTWWEFHMGYNPCTPQSFGCINDADLDFDADGIPNGDDEWPICNMNDPGGWQTDCI